MQYDGEAQHAKGLIKSMWKYIPRKFVGVSFFKTSTGEWSWSEQLFSWFNSFKRFVIDLNESPFIQSFNCISLMIFLPLRTDSSFSRLRSWSVKNFPWIYPDGLWIKIFKLPYLPSAKFGWSVSAQIKLLPDSMRAAFSTSVLWYSYSTT